MTSQNVSYQLVPPGIHRRNAAERAIRTFKNHFIAGLSSTDSNFPMHLWDKLLDRAVLSLTKSAWEDLFGRFDYNATHLSNLCFFYFFLIYYSVGTIWITTKLCHIRFNLTRQSNRIKESRIFRFDWIYVGPSIGTQLSLLKGSQFRSKCGRSDPKGYCRVDTLVCLLNYQADGSPFWNQFLVVALRDAERMSSTMSVYNVRSPRPLWKAYG